MSQNNHPSNRSIMIRAVTWITLSCLLGAATWIVFSDELYSRLIEPPGDSAFGDVQGLLQVAGMFSSLAIPASFIAYVAKPLMDRCMARRPIQLRIGKNTIEYRWNDRASEHTQAFEVSSGHCFSSVNELVSDPVAFTEAIRAVLMELRPRLKPFGEVKVERPISKSQRQIIGESLRSLDSFMSMNVDWELERSDRASTQ